ncbi:MAG: T9SS type A sorting domain-containing protein, partial [Melioribacteraceae bacterium]|nr:T9SS type A sorting domain-containing protein [Melioribacteraceae bacterium]
PFNPSTTIKYSIPPVGRDLSRPNVSELKSALQVTLKIYDILGREVAALVNKQQKPGYYEVNWNATEMPSGIYFYRIQAYPITGGAAQFVKTNKMILLK